MFQFYVMAHYDWNPFSEMKTSCVLEERYMYMAVPAVIQKVNLFLCCVNIHQQILLTGSSAVDSHTV